MIVVISPAVQGNDRRFYIGPMTAESFSLTSGTLGWGTHHSNKQQRESAYLPNHHAKMAAPKMANV